MSNPSFGTQFSSQFWYSCLIPVLVHNSQLSSGVLLSSESLMLYLDLHLYHSTHFAQPCLARGKALVHMFNLCFATNVLFKLSKLHFSLHQWHGTRIPSQGQAPGCPSTHVQFQFWYTSLISVFLPMFYLHYQSYTLTCTNGMALTVLSQLARGKPLGPLSPHV